MSCKLLAAASTRVAVVEVPHRDRNCNSDFLLLILLSLGTGAGARLLLLGGILVLCGVALILVF